METATDQSGQGNFLIVIGRECGSGGRRIGRMLAERLGVPYYDKSLLAHAAARLGYSPSIFEQCDERRPSPFRSLFAFAYGSMNSTFDQSAMSAERIYQFQSDVIRDLCAEQSCVIVGRTADYIMRDHPRMVSIFVHAPLELRGAELCRRGEAADARAGAELAARRDRDRENYYNYFTNRHTWGRARNYHLSFDSSRISDDAIEATVRCLLV